MSEDRKGFIGLFIPAEVWERTDLPVPVRVLYAEIHALARGAKERGKPGCYKSTTTFADEYGVTLKTMKSWIKQLRDSGLVQQVAFDGRVRYLDVWSGAPAAGVETTPAGGVKSEPAAGVKIGLHKENSKENSKTNTYTADAVIDYLNSRASKRYRHTDANRKPIVARLNEGFTQQDCERVVDNKTGEWLGTEMEKYIRPATLFSPSKFEGYLNQTPAKRTKTIAEIEAELMAEEAS
jgi:uncharacterized phage protein (TIGR02220 family)